MANEHEPKRIAIACQGGGSHAAFSAGVLKRLLSEDQNYFEIKALSGTSGGKHSLGRACYHRRGAERPGLFPQRVRPAQHLQRVVRELVGPKTAGSRAGHLSSGRILVIN